jgi:hypothetical protein
MDELRYTLLADGASDDALLPVISWLLNQRLPSTALQAQWADLRHSTNDRAPGLAGRISAAIELYPCDLLFIHRDAEREPSRNREAEIHEACECLSCATPFVCVVPIRMTEAWLLFDEPAIRRAAGNPNGRMTIGIPRLRQVEDLPDPKNTLRDLLRTASGLTGRRLQNFKVMPRRVASLIDDFSPLRALSAFQQLELALDTSLREMSDTLKL